MGFVFYDLETTGLNTFFDQIIQFAAILTDSDFNEIDRLVLRCQIQPHLVPSPEALLINKACPEQLLDPSRLTHYEMVCRIEEKLISWSPSIFIGWNSIKFDEVFLRQALYQSVCNPYLTAFHQNGRVDAMRVVQAAHVYEPIKFQLPRKDDGTYSFKLSDVASINGFSEHQAHDALSDVQATIFLMKKISNELECLWSNASRFSKKRSVINFLDEQDFVAYFAHERGGSRPLIVAQLGEVKSQPTDRLVIDLSVAPEVLMGLDDESLKLYLLEASTSPIYSVRLNAAPILEYAEDICDLDISGVIDFDVAEARAVVYSQSPELVNRLLCAYESNLNKFESSNIVESQIYDDFMSSETERQAELFHKASWDKKTYFAQQISDMRYQHFAYRILYAHFPEGLCEDTNNFFEQECRSRWLFPSDESNAWRTFHDAMREFEELPDELDADPTQIDRLKSFLLSRKNDYELAR